MKLDEFCNIPKVFGNALPGERDLMRYNFISRNLLYFAIMRSLGKKRKICESVKAPQINFKAYCAELNNVHI